jgi:hypothetical protein
MAKTKLNYELTKNRRPASWQLPIKNIMLEKFDGKKSLGLRNIEYIPGEVSIFKEDHQGDQEPPGVWFEDGALQVDSANKVLVEILTKHPWNRIHFNKVDHDVTASKNIDLMELRFKAYEAVSSKDSEEMKARAFVLLGAYVISQSDKLIESQLKQFAMDDPEKVLEEMKQPDYAPKTVAALAVLRGVLLINPTNTQISWADTGRSLINIAAGQDPISKLGQFLSGKDESAKLTLQEIGEKITRSYEFKKDYTASEEIQSILANKDEDSVDSHKSKEGDDLDLKEAREEYEDDFNKPVPINKKNDLGWIKEKIAEGPKAD